MYIVPLRRVIQSNHSLISKPEHSCSGQSFRNRAGCKNCLGGGWNLLFTIRGAERFFAHYVPVLSDGKSKSRELTFHHAFTGGRNNLGKMQGQAGVITPCLNKR